MLETSSLSKRKRSGRRSATTDDKDQFITQQLSGNFSRKNYCEKSIAETNKLEWAIQHKNLSLEKWYYGHTNLNSKQLVQNVDHFWGGR
ncbi:hypothetical protein Trydic_g18818 [Trypoxylus dichotomus]